MPDISPTFSTLTQTPFTSPNVGGWYFSQNIGLVPDTVAPFLAAHGFLVNGGTEHYIAGEFAGYLLNMERNKFSRLDAMQILLNTMVTTFNEGRSLNSTRYTDLVTNLQGLLSNNQADIKSFIEGSVTNSGGYVTLMLTTLDQLEADQASFASDIMSYDTGERATELASLKTTWAAAYAAAETEYGLMTAGLDIPALIASVETAITAMTTALTNFTTDFSTLTATLLADYTAHETLATGYLTGLGTTDLARLNAKYDAMLTSQNQLLVNRGLYSSALAAQVTAAVERDRSEETGLLNDRLNREKLDNQHKLYEEKYRMRLGSLDASYKVIQGCAEVVQARLAEGQWASRVRHEVAQLSINARLSLLGLREKYYQFLLQSIDWQTDRRMKIYDALFKTRMESLRIRQSVGGFHSELIKYQLDSRSQLALALFGLVERREDEYPGVGDMASLISSMGDDQ